MAKIAWSFPNFFDKPSIGDRHGSAAILAVFERAGWKTALSGHNPTADMAGTVTCPYCA